MANLNDVQGDGYIRSDMLDVQGAKGDTFTQGNDNSTMPFIPDMPTTKDNTEEEMQ